MSDDKNLFANSSSESLVAFASQLTRTADRLLEPYRLFDRAIESPVFDKDDVVIAYKSLLKLFEGSIIAGQMSIEAELVTRDLTDIDPEED